MVRVTCNKVDQTRVIFRSIQMAKLKLEYIGDLISLLSFILGCLGPIKMDGTFPPLPGCFL